MEEPTSGTAKYVPPCTRAKIPPVPSCREMTSALCRSLPTGNIISDPWILFNQDLALNILW